MEKIHSVEAVKSSEIARAERVLASLGLSSKDLEDKKTLDVGSGRGFIAKAAEVWGVDVISLERDPYLPMAVDAMPSRRISDPDKEAEVFREKYKEVKSKVPETPHLVIGDARSLPFADESFDLVISHAGPINIYRKKPEEWQKIFDETLRVLKAGGEFRFGPASSEEISLPTVTKHDSGAGMSYYSIIK